MADPSLFAIVKPESMYHNGTVQIKNVELRYVATAWINSLIGFILMIRAFPNDQPAGPIDWWVGIAVLLGQCLVFCLAAGLPGYVLRKLGMRAVGAAVSAVLYTAVVWVILIESFVYSFFKFHINEMVMTLLMGDDIAQILALPLLTWVIGFGLIGVVFAVQIALYNGLGRIRFSIQRKIVGIAAITLVQLVVVAALTSVAELRNDVPMLARARIAPWFVPPPLRSFKQAVDFDVDHANFHMDFDESRALNYPLQPVECTGTTNLPNFLFILVDSLRQDMFDAETMPLSTEWSTHTTRFRNHLSASNGTQYGVFGLFNGVPGTYWRSFRDADLGSIFVQQMLKSDYQFWLHPSAPLHNPEFHRTVFAGVPEAIVEIGPPPVYQRDRDTTDQMIKKMRDFASGDRSQPFFGLLFYDAAHAYNPPPGHRPFEPYWEQVPYERLNALSPREPFFNLFRNAANYDDQLIREVLDELADTGLAENTIVVLTSDHGQSFNEQRNNIWNHSGSFQPAETFVPMAVHMPARYQWPVTEVTNVTTHYDVVPSFMQDVFACSNPLETYTVGSHLLDSDPREAIFMHSYSRSALFAPDASEYWVWETSGREHMTADGRWQVPQQDPSVETLEQVFEQVSRYWKD